MKKRTLVVIDIQKEYTTPGRPFYLEQAGPSLKKAKEVLEGARLRGWPVVHVKHLQDGDLFSRTGAFSGYVDEFTPLPGETEIVKGDYSCYSSPEFARLAAAAEGELVVIGYGSTMCCLSTIVDGYHRGGKFLFVKDASSAKRTATLDESSVHRTVTEILSIYSKVVSAEELFAS